MPTFAKEFLRIVYQQLDLGEVGGNNAGPIVAKYKRRNKWAPGEDLGPWCASATSWCLEEAAGGQEEAAKLLNVSLGTWRRRRHAARGLYAMLKARYGAIKPTETPKPGMLALWKRGTLGWQGHISPVVSIGDDGIFHVIEFNRGVPPATVRVYKHIAGEQNLLGFVNIA